LCRRKLLVHQNTPSLQRYGAIRVYQFANQQRITLRCSGTNAQLPHTLTLEGTRLLHNLTECRIMSTELHTFPELHGTTYARIEPPIIYLPDNISVLDSHELHQIRDMPIPNLQTLNDIYFRVTAAQHTYDLDAIMHVHQASLRQTQQTNWVVIPLTPMATFTTLGILLYFLCNRFRNSYCKGCKTRLPHHPPNHPSNPVNHITKPRLQAMRMPVQTCYLHRTRRHSQSDAAADTPTRQPGGENPRMCKLAVFHRHELVPISTTTLPLVDPQQRTCMLQCFHCTMYTYIITDLWQNLIKIPCYGSCKYLWV
jgi:hypothetical protein